MHIRLRPVSLASFLLLTLSAVGCTKPPLLPGCGSDDDCKVGSTTGGVCETVSRRCVVCVSDAHCADPASPRCDLRGNRCVRCLESAECDRGFTCSDGRCVRGCDTDAPCPTGQFCQSGQRVCVECENDTQCAGRIGTERCLLSTSTCVACLEDAHCAAGTVCRGNRCVEGCSGTQRCPEGKVCDEPAGACVNCLRDSDCKLAATPRCDLPRNTCVACLPSADNCPSGMYCAGTTCAAGCRSDVDCQFGTPPPAASGRTRCLVGPHACVQCLPNRADCPQGMFCGSDNTCQAGCLNDSQCALAESCCGSVCQSLISTANCGACGNRCAVGSGCCSATCTRLDTTANCGACGVACDGNQVCCPASGCTNFLTDPRNCGGCGNSCDTDQICCSGQCKGVSVPGTCVVCDKACLSQQIAGSSFANGRFDNTGIVNGRLSIPTTASPQTPFVWVTMQDTNEVNQVNARTGALVGTYSSRGGNPSRGAQALDGSFWVANRCPNAPNNPECSNVAQILPDGSAGCTVARTADGAPLPQVQSVAIDANGFVWVGTWNDRRVHQIDPVSCRTVRSVALVATGGATSNPNALAIDSKGILWNSTAGTGPSIGVDTATGTVVGSLATQAYNTEGIVVDRKDNVFFSLPQAAVLRVDAISRSVQVLQGQPQGSYQSRNLTLDTDGNVWAAWWPTSNGTPSYAARFSGGTGAFLGSSSFNDVGGGIGIGADAYGKVWLIGNGTRNVVRFSKDNGLAEVTTALRGSNPQVIGDITGFALRSVTTQNGQVGFWTIDFDGRQPDTTWGSARWQADVPAGTALSVRFRAASGFGGLSSATWCGPFSTSPVDLTRCNFGPRQWLEAEVRLRTRDVSRPPSVSDFTVFWQN